MRSHSLCPSRSDSSTRSQPAAAGGGRPFSGLSKVPFPADTASSCPPALHGHAACTPRRRALPFHRADRSKEPTPSGHCSLPISPRPEPLRGEGGCAWNSFSDKRQRHRGRARQRAPAFLLLSAVCLCVFFDFTPCLPLNGLRHFPCGLPPRSSEKPLLRTPKAASLEAGPCRSAETTRGREPTTYSCSLFRRNSEKEIPSRAAQTSSG